MCGFAGIYGKPDRERLMRMMEQIRHRGPDGEGIVQIGDTLLGHVRLAIMDVEGGVQPMTNERGSLAVAFNGEIYNHVSLRRRLKGRHGFKTHSDTEVLAHLYEEEGEDMLRMLDGMFALALAGPHGLLLARDPVGIKPLYYGYKDNIFMTASELKAFPEMDELHSLPPGHYLMAGGEPKPFGPLFPVERPLAEMDLPEALDGIRWRVEEAVLKRLMSNVPVGVYLSGGLDSSLVTALMRPHTAALHSFTAGLAGAPDLDAARQVARHLRTEHHELVYTEQEIEDALPKIIRCIESFDAPLVRSAIPMYFVSRLASEHVKVVLTGEGADELFAGYEYLRNLGTSPMLRDEMAKIFARLENTNLQRADRATMAWGVEARVPFLDLRLARFVMRLPTELVAPLEGRAEKWLLREAFKGYLPPAIMGRKKLKFSQGAGSSETVAKRLRAAVSPARYEKMKHEARERGLRSPEELHYYRIWREMMGPHISPTIVGRTADLTAAA